MSLPGGTVYKQVRGHSKPSQGFWRPDHMLSAEEVERAVAELRQLGGPMAAWNRCQGLAEVAQGVADRKQRAELLREAFANANELKEPNRIVTLAAWPLRTLLDTGEGEWFKRELERLLPIILDEPNPFRRQDGLYALLFVDAPRQCFDQVLSLYRKACAGPQKALTMRRVAQYINRLDHGEAREICVLMAERRRRRRCLRAIVAEPTP